ncbi:MAG: hypothetical protein EXR72_10715 [Myxococcales bacterium]|nr:hypothetical protein [Myxococcales bacterium]
MHITEQDFHTALDQALDFVKATTLNHPSVERMEAIVAWSYDPTGSMADTLDGVLSLDSRLRDIALRIIVGACEHGRPPTTYPRRDEVEALYFRRRRDRAATDEAHDERAPGVPIDRALRRTLRAVESAHDRGCAAERGDQPKVDSLTALATALRVGGLHAVVGPTELTSALLVRLALDFAIEEKAATVFASSRGPAESLALRLVADEASVEPAALRVGALDQRGMIYLTRAASVVSETPITLLPRATVGDVVAAVDSNPRVVLVEDFLTVAAGRAAVEIQDLAAAVGASKAAVVLAIEAPSGATLGDIGLDDEALDCVVSVRARGRAVEVVVERCGLPAGKFELEYHAEREALTIPKGEQLDQRGR